MNKEKVVIFGAGKNGEIAVATLKYEKHILGIIDNDELKWGKYLDKFKIYSLEESRIFLNEEIRIVIAVAAFSEIVLQLEKNGLHNYVYFEDVYANDYARAGKSWIKIYLTIQLDNLREKKLKMDG